MPRLELRSVLDRDTLDAILSLIDTATRMEGHRPVGEHKYSHLKLDATGWGGVLAWDGDHLVGYAHMRWNAREDVPRTAVEAVVHPDWYGSDVAERLLTEVRALVGRTGGGVLFVWVHHVQDSSTTLVARMGFAVQRELAFMARPLPSAPEVADLPEGITLRAYREGVDDEAFLRVNNAAFEGHPENGGWDLAEFAERRARSWFDAQGLLMAWRMAPDGAERCLGFHWTKWHAHDSDEVPAHEPVGEVYVLGVDPTAQGLGLGRTLLRAGLAYLRSRGCRQAILYVDLASAGAVALYESEGFRTQYAEVCYAEDVPALLSEEPRELRRPAE